MTVHEAHAKILKSAVNKANEAVSADASLPLQGSVYTAFPTGGPFCMEIEPTVATEYIPQLRQLAVTAVHEALLETEINGKNLLAALIVGHAHQGVSYFDVSS